MDRSSRLLLGGDVNINRADPGAALRPLLPVLEGADVRFVNLEGALCEPSADPGRPDLPHKPRWRHSPPRMAAGLTAAGIDVVSCANNVTYPPAAAVAGLAVLDRHGIAHCGAGSDLAAARAPAIVGGAGFLAYTSIFFPYGHAATVDTAGVATVRAQTSYRPDPRVAEVPGRPPVVLTAADPDDLAALGDDVRRLRRRVATVVVSMHWGLPGDGVCDYQRQIAYAAIDAGADAVAGHGPHTVHGIELYRNRPIFYSLGNVVFDWPVMHGRGDGLLAVLDPGGSRIELHPVSPTNPAAAERVVALSAALGTTVHRWGGRLSIAWWP